ncbi:MAG TPA: Ku protein [Candidatus Aquilonibacter sp.]|nr:Ku protein [Candidatus Aquilonibacter sp.]
MAASIWKGALTFGLLSIPIRLYAAARPERTQLHQLHKKCHTRLRQPLYCLTCNRIVNRNEVVKGYEYEKGRYVIVDKEELLKITPESGHSMEMLAFVKSDQIDPIYYESSFAALPDKDADKPYQLLLKALEETQRVGIAKFTMHQREYTVFVRPRDGGITIHTMYFVNEIRQVPGYGEKPKNLQLKPQELKLAEQLIESLSEDFNPAQYHDTYQEQLRALVEAKQKGKTLAEKAAPKQAKVIDMMEALKRSLRDAETGAKRRHPGPTEAATRRHARRAAS